MSESETVTALDVIDLQGIFMLSRGNTIGTTVAVECYSELCIGEALYGG